MCRMVGYSTYGVGGGWAGGDEVDRLQLFEKPSQTDQRYPSFSRPLTEYDGPNSSALDLVTQPELDMGPGLELLSSLTTVTIVSIWMVMPMSAPPILDRHLTGALSVLAHTSFALSVRFGR